MSTGSSNMMGMSMDGPGGMSTDDSSMMMSGTNAANSGGFGAFGS